MKKFKAVIFDLDGTLLNTIHDIASSMNEVLRLNKFPAHSDSEYKKMVGDGMEMLVRRALPADIEDEKVIKDCIFKMRDEYSKRWNISSRPYPGVKEMLNYLRENGIRMSILSNKPDDFTKLTVSSLLSGWDFEVVMGIRNGILKKPAPDGALKIAADMSLNADNFLYVGDTATDMKTAVAAGMFPVGVLWGFRDADELLANGAEELLKKPLDLHRLIF